jgi:hypothetical protein
VRTDGSPSLTLVQGGDGEGESGSASTIFGPVSRGLTTTPTTPSRPLSESLRDLERTVDDLVSRYFEVCATLITVTEVLVRRGRSGSVTITTEGESNA